MKSYAIFLLLGLLLIVPQASSSETWLRGKWVQTYDPDSKKPEGDWLLFQKDGEVALGSHGGIYLRCPYQLSSKTVVLNCVYKGQAKPLELQVRDNYRQLVNPSGSIYTQQQK